MRRRTAVNIQELLEMRVAYCNSEGKTFEFLNNRKIKFKEADFHKYNYGYESIDLGIGVKINQFKKEPYKTKLELYFYGSAKNRGKEIAEFHDATIVDINKMHTGKLIWEEWYIPCYIIEGDTYPSETQANATVQEATLLCPRPFWIKEKNLQFLPQKQEQTVEGLDFPTDFPFDFTTEEFGVEVQEVDHFVESDFLMRFYGPCSNPKLTINGYPYQIFTTLETNEYLEINSRKNSIIKYMANGTTANLYNSRSFEYSVFEKIPSGRLVFNWIGTFGIDITLFLERGVPKRW